METCLKNDFTIMQAETGKYMLYTPHKKYYIPALYYVIIQLLKEGKTIDEIEKEFEGKVPRNEIEKTITESFARMGILRNSSYDTSTKKRLLIWRKDVIEPAFLYNRNLVSFLYHKYTIVLFLISYIAIYSLGLCQFDLKKINYLTIENSEGFIAIFYLILFYISNFAHELGHYLSSIWVGAKPGKIGIGIYLITPVLYASLDDIWRLSVKKRYIVNIAGVYFQSIFLLFFAGIALIFHQKVAFLICFLGNIGSLLNLFPFLKFDGYWMVSDYLDTNELMSKSVRYITSFFGRTEDRYCYTSKSKKKEAIFKTYSFTLGIFIIVYAIFFIKILCDNSLVLFHIFTKATYGFSYLRLGLRSVFIIITSVKIINVVHSMIKRRNVH